MLTALKRFFAWLSNCIYPRGLVCICCGKELSDVEREAEICSDCADRLPMREKDVCTRCGETLVDGSCPFCDSDGKEANAPGYDKIVAPMIYEAMARKWIIDYKDDGKPWLAENISYFIADACRAENADIITFVPTYKRAARRRGFDNSAYLAKRTARRLNLPCEKTLVRTSQSKDNPNLSRSERYANIKGSFAVSEKLKAVALKDKNVLLVDDVLTTGATASECAFLLKKLGARKVVVAVLCRTALKNTY